MEHEDWSGVAFHVMREEKNRLRAALQRIDGINDNPAVYNPDIEVVLRAALKEWAEEQ